VTAAVATSKHPGATVDTLVERWQKHGDADAREQLVKQFQPLARSLARRYSRSSVPMDDLVQVAYVGLLQAIDRFDAERGGTLQAFALPTILGELRRYFRDHSWSVHVTRGGQERSMAVGRARDRLTNELGRAPTVQQLAQYMEVDMEDVLDGLQALNAYETAPLDAPVSSDGEAATLLDLLGEPDPGYELADQKTDLRQALQELPDREREVLRMRFHEELTQSAIGARIGCSQMQVSRLIRAALTELRQELA
jgi:RNA polymerase sigma-B factor